MTFVFFLRSIDFCCISNTQILLWRKMHLKFIRSHRKQTRNLTWQPPSFASISSLLLSFPINLLLLLCCQACASQSRSLAFLPSYFRCIKVSNIMTLNKIGCDLKIELLLAFPFRIDEKRKYHKYMKCEIAIFGVCMPEWKCTSKFYTLYMYL